MTVYSIGTAGTPWGAAERATWRARQIKQRDYRADVLTAAEALRTRFDVITHGHLETGVDGTFPLIAIRTRGWDARLPTMLVTGGVHGYETSGVHGALAFVDRHGEELLGRANVIVAPCVSPWAYERIQRWSPDANDPNRSFEGDGRTPESAALITLIRPLRDAIVVHVDLHETTDTDESEFRPALAARDGKPFEPGTIPDGFYLVDDTENPQPAFQAAVIDAVQKVTHIAAADPDGTMIGTQVVAPGVIRYPLRALGLCTSLTGARFTTTTEVYPDSPKATPAQCVDAQVAAVRAAIGFALTAGS